MTINNYNPYVTGLTATTLSYPVSLDDLKLQLRIDEDCYTHDQRLSAFVKASIAAVEKRINHHIAHKRFNRKIQQFSDTKLVIYNFPLYEINTITLDGVGITSYGLKIEHNRFEINFGETVTGELIINYEVGYPKGECPLDIEQAVLLYAASLFNEVNGQYMPSTWVVDRTLDRLLEPYKVVNL